MSKTAVKIRRRVFWALGILVAAAAIYFAALRTIVVEGQRVDRGIVVAEAFGTGTLESRKTVDVSFEVTGRIAKLAVDQGDAIRSGQRLAVLDDRTLVAALALAQQEVAFAEAGSQRLDADIARAQAVAKGARAALARTRPLAESGTASVEALEVAEEREKIATAELARAESASAEGRSAIATALARRDLAAAALERSIVDSPFDGVVMKRVREVGDVAVPGAPVLTIAASDVVWARVWIDESYLAALQLGQRARIVLRSQPGTEVAGKVERIGREVDRETRELLVDVAFATAPPTLVFGQRVDVWIEVARKHDALRVPAAYARRSADGDGVFVLVDGRARWRRVSLGLRGGDFVEVLDGLTVGDVVLEPFLASQKALADGQRVALRSTSTESDG